MNKRIVLAGIILFAISSPMSAADIHPQSPWQALTDVTPVRMTCKSVSNCAEAVILWCGGYFGADRDGDGIPCETVCSSREEVMAIEAEIGCRL